LNKKQEKLYNHFVDKYDKPEQKGLYGIIKSMIGNIESLDDELNHQEDVEDIEGINSLIDDYLSLMGRLSKKDFRLNRDEYDLLDDKLGNYEEEYGPQGWVTVLQNKIKIIKESRY
jgi:hypothetical protein